MALSEWISYKNAEWTHQDNQAKVRATERATDEQIRANKVNEAFQEKKLRWEKEKFPIEQATSRYGAENRGIAAKQLEVSTYPQMQGYQLEQIAVKERESNARALLNAQTELIRNQQVLANNILTTNIRSATDVKIANIGAESKLESAPVSAEVGTKGVKLSVSQKTANSAVDWLGNVFSPTNVKRAAVEAVNKTFD